MSQHGIARLVPEAVVDGFESVQINEQDGNSPCAAMGVVKTEVKVKSSRPQIFFSILLMSPMM
jgi:hypothetical protein